MMAQDRCAFRYDYPHPHEHLDSGCQFTGETELFPWHGTLYCRFHLPLHDLEGQPTAKADWQDSESCGGRVFRAAVERQVADARTANTKLNLSGVVFPGDVAFDETAIPTSLWCAARFHGRVSFVNATFQGSVVFRDARFLGFAYFWDAEFQGIAAFLKAEFQGNANFQSAKFQSDAHFRDAEFQRDAYFRAAKFQGYADFQNAEFWVWAQFQDAEFQGDAYFRDAEFHGYAYFREAEFQRDADFVFSDHPSIPQRRAAAEDSNPSDRPSGEPDDAPASGHGAFQVLWFRDAQFGGRANFSNRRFKQATDFSGCRFGQAPRFHNATLHQDTDWQGAEFKERSGGEAERAYRTLRLAMETNRDRPQEAVFFALEQQAMRNNLPWWHAHRWVSFAYQVTSSYGRNGVRPFLWLVGSLVAFFLTYWVLDGQRLMDAERASALTTFTAQQAVKPFAVWGRIATDLSPLFPYQPARGAIVPLGFKLLATLQSVLNLSFVALFILALRWLFKRG